MEINPLYSRYVEENEEFNVEEFNESHTRCQRSSHSPESTKSIQTAIFFIILVHVHYESSMMLLAGQGRRKV